MIKILNGIIYRAKGLWGLINGFFYQNPKILDSKTSLRLILETKHSIARFGDGEFNIMRGGQIGFQKADVKLANRLHEVINGKVEGLEIGIPDVFGDLSAYEKKSARFWRAYLGVHRREIVRLLDMDKTYLNTNMTRFWTGYRDKSSVRDIIKLYKAIWKDKKIVFVEGELTRMGVGNDLFSEAESISRILCPAENAWNRYDKIINTILELNLCKDTLFILALGPTATVLAYDLTKNGYQALDLGHLDVQYEYSLRNAKWKIALEGKYVNENIEGREVSDSIIDDVYKNSVIAKIV